LFLVDSLLIGARRALWYEFTADEKRKTFLSASTLGDLLVTPPVAWKEFANAWIAIDGDEVSRGEDEVDELAVAMGNWASREQNEEEMQA
jgi:hypothetical protein